MVKQGPCRHCGVTSTPLWRNGPPEKPVLCNACGSRWRTKGSFTNYNPLHLRAEPDDYQDCKVWSARTANVDKTKEVKLLKRKKNRNNDVVGFGGELYDHSHSYRKFVDEDDASNRSSSGSGESNSESFGPSSSTVGSDLTGPGQSAVQDTSAPSKKRTCFGHSKPSPIEKFAQELYAIWQEQQSCCSKSPEEELLYQSDTSMVSVEMGHGSVLIRHPSETAHEVDSEASSLPAEAKPYPINEAHPRPAALFVHSEDKGATFQAPFVHNEDKGATFQALGNVRSEKLPGQLTMNGEQRNKVADVHGIQRLLGSRDSPLCAVDLNDIVNFDVFAAQFTNQEQRQLLKYLPKSDVERYPVSIKALFDAPRFRESLLSFQQLLAGGIFDLTFPDVKPDDCRNVRRLALSNPMKSIWIQQYNTLKKIKNRSAGHNEVGSSAAEKLVQKSPESDTELLPKDPSMVKMKHTTEAKEELGDTGGAGFHLKRLSDYLAENRSSLMSQPTGYTDADNDQDLLLDVPSNNAFPQAELLYPNQGLMSPSFSRCL